MVYHNTWHVSKTFKNDNSTKQFRTCDTSNTKMHLG